MNERFSLTSWVESELLAHDPKKIFTFVCGCAECDPKKWVKVYANQLPAIAKKAGYTDLLTRAEFDELAHRTIQIVGR